MNKRTRKVSDVCKELMGIRENFKMMSGGSYPVCLDEAIDLILIKYSLNSKVYKEEK